MAGGKPTQSTGFYEAVRDMGGDILVKPCSICKRRLRAKIPTKDGGVLTFCGACDHGFDWTTVRASGG